MDARRARWIVAAMTIGVAAHAAPARAFTMAEQLATTGVQGTLAGTGARSGASTLNSVKKSLAVSQPRLASGGVTPTGPGAGSPRGVRKKSGGSGKSGWSGAGKGWAKAGAGGGKAHGSWVGASGGGWAKSEGWASKSNAWASPKDGGGWARPGGKS